MHKCGICGVRLSIRSSRLCILSIQIHISSLFYHQVATPFYSFSLRNIMAQFRREPPQRGRRMQVVWAKIAILNQCLALSHVVNSVRCYQSTQWTVTSWWHWSQVAVSGRVCWWWEMMMKCLWQDAKEQHLIVCSGKFEAEVTIIKDCDRVIVTEANYWQTQASCGLSATAGLLVDSLSHDRCSQQQTVMAEAADE